MVDHSLPPRPPLSTASLLVRLACIQGVVAVVVGAFAYVNGTLDPQRLRPKTLVNALKPITACIRAFAVTMPRACVRGRVFPEQYRGPCVFQCPGVQR